MSGEETPEEPAPRPGLAPKLSAYAGIIAPTSLIAALLVYFGYVSTQARFRYFGVYLDLVNLSSTDLLLYGSESVFIAVLLVAFAALAAAGLHLAGRRLVCDPRLDGVSGWVVLAVPFAGALLMLRAVVGIFFPSAIRLEYPGLTALSLLLGALLLRYGLWLWQARAARRRKPSQMPPSEVLDVCRYVLLALIVAGLFWVTGVFARAYGEGGAEREARILPYRPAVVLYTQDAIDDLPVGAVHADLGKGKRFRHRYTGLRLLVESDGRLFLAPVPWSPWTSRVLVVPNTPDIRLQLIPIPGS